MPNFYIEIKDRALEILRSGEGFDKLPFEELLRAEHCNINYNAKTALATAQGEVERREQLPRNRSVFSNKEFTKATNRITRQLWKAGEPYHKRLGVRYYSVSKEARQHRLIFPEKSR
jgi:hypothetical protein